MKLPLITKRYLRTLNDERKARLVRQFHRWMKRWKLSFYSLRRSHVDAFVRYPEERKIKPRTTSTYRTTLIPYLQYIFKAGYLKFDPACLRKRPSIKPLPEQSESFLRHLEATLKMSTCKGYRGSLRNFYRWLDANALSLNDVTRRHMTDWLTHLNDGKRSASSRSAKVVHIRIYLYWLNEQGTLKTAFNRLIKTNDIPKLPEYLPRPLPPNTDRELQARLGSSSCKYHLGLLLMRKTGIRVGELISLEQNCIWTNPKGSSFLKVPLGKLDNERLVPLDDKALRTAKKLQKLDSTRKKIFLIERNTPQRKTYYRPYAKALLNAAKGLQTDGKITTHRLRHTYATSLLNGGMSLLGLMKLLGHRSYRMTLRYAAVSQETIGKEYFEALDRIQNHYDTSHLQTTTPIHIDPDKMLSDIIRWIQNRTVSGTNKPHLIKPLIKRIQRIQAALANLNI